MMSRMQHKLDENRLSQPRKATFGYILLGSILILLALVLSGCKKDPRVTFIQGIWFYKDEHLKNFPGESAQVTNWEFDNGYFSMYSCCFTEVDFSGYYSVADREENQLTLDLFNLNGQRGSTPYRKTDTMSIIIKIDPEADTIMVNCDGPYNRLGP